MSNRNLIILSLLVAALLILTGTIWYFRSRDAGVPLYNPFQTQLQTKETTKYDPPSDFSTQYDRLAPATTTDPSIVDPITLPAGLLE